MTHVYGLYDEFSNVPFYIGVTIAPKKRLWAHKATLDGKRRDALTGCKVKSVNLSMRLLAQCDDRAHAETIEHALQIHYGIKVIKTERLI